MRGVLIVLFAILGLVVVLAGLSPGARSATADPGDIRTLAPVLEVKLKEWIVAWRAIIPGFNIRQFKKNSTWSGFLNGPWAAADLKAIQSDPLLAFYAVSPNGRWIVNPYGGISLLGSEITSDVDTSVVLIDRKTSKQRNILFCGTPCGFHEAVWTSDPTLFVAWHAEESNPGCPGGYGRGPNLNSFDFGGNSTASYGYVGPVSCRGIGFDYVSHKIQKKIPNVK